MTLAEIIIKAILDADKGPQPLELGADLRRRLQDRATMRTAMTSNTETELEHLAERWLVVKDAEREANAERLRIEDKILVLIPAKEEGQTSWTMTNGYKLKMVGKLSYKADMDTLLRVTLDWPEGQRPVKTEVKADEAALKFLRANRPDLWSRIASAVTTKPMKTSITIEEIE
jgi:hypothetical protein